MIVFILVAQKRMDVTFPGGGCDTEKKSWHISPPQRLIEKSQALACVVSSSRLSLHTPPIDSSPLRTLPVPCPDSTHRYVPYGEGSVLLCDPDNDVKPDPTTTTPRNFLPNSANSA